LLEEGYSAHPRRQVNPFKNDFLNTKGAIQDEREIRRLSITTKK
jgi:hypothetical protein